MATIIQIKRSTGTTAPSTLQDGELAYTHGTGTQANNGDRLFIGDGSSVNVIGGEYFTTKLDHVDGTLTASSAITVDANKAVDDFIVGNNSTTGGSMKFKEGTSNGTDHVALKAPNSLGSSVTFTLPSADGSAGQFLTTNGSGELSFGTVTQTLSIAADTGTSDSVSTGETITFTGGEGIDTTVTNNTITIAGEDATSSNKGIASFDATDFTVSSGAVTLNAERVEDITGAQLVTNGSHTRLTATYDDANDGAIDLVVDGDLANYSNANSGFLTAETNDLSAAVVWANVPDANITQSSVTQHQAALSIATTQLTGTITNAQLAGSITNAKLVNSSITIGSDTVSLGATQTDLNGITSLDVDNLTLDGNTVSTTDTNGDLVLSPNGTGTVTVPSGYEARAGFGSDSLVNKTYVDQVANGLDVKASCRVATTADLSATYNNGAGTLTATSNGAISVDGVTLSVDDRVLVKDQSTAQENGIYKVTTTGGASAAFVLTRTPDANDAAELTGGAFTFVEEGTANADNGYVATHNGIPTFGTTAISFDQFSGAGQISAGNGLTKTGNTIDAVGTSNRISVSANAIDIASTYVGQSSITTLGTIATGTWNADVIGEVYGGTGQSSYTTGDILYASASNTLAKLALGTSGQVLQSNGTNIVYGDIDGGTF